MGWIVLENGLRLHDDNWEPGELEELEDRVSRCYGFTSNSARNKRPPVAGGVRKPHRQPPEE